MADVSTRDHNLQILSCFAPSLYRFLAVDILMRYTVPLALASPVQHLFLMYLSPVSCGETFMWRKGRHVLVYKIQAVSKPL